MNDALARTTALTLMRILRVPVDSSILEEAAGVIASALADALKQDREIRKADRD